MQREKTPGKGKKKVIASNDTKKNQAIWQGYTAEKK
jgi:hypothetical protein